MAPKRFIPCQTMDPELWHPVGFTGPAIDQAEQAKAWCGLCPIKDPCLERALESNEWGVWGGTTKGERDAMLRRGRIGTGEGRTKLNRELASAQGT